MSSDQEPLEINQQNNMKRIPR
jgi:hypothetical protein